MFTDENLNSWQIYQALKRKNIRNPFFIEHKQQFFIAFEYYTDNWQGGSWIECIYSTFFSLSKYNWIRYKTLEDAQHDAYKLGFKPDQMSLRKIIHVLNLSYKPHCFSFKYTNIDNI